MNDLSKIQGIHDARAKAEARPISAALAAFWRMTKLPAGTVTLAQRAEQRANAQLHLAEGIVAETMAETSQLPAVDNRRKAEECMVEAVEALRRARQNITAANQPADYRVR